LQSLRDVQRAFARALTAADAREISGLVAHRGIEPAARLRIYRNNHRENSLAALRSTYPVIERLVGEDYFRQAACEFLAHHPSRSGNLDALGERFPQYLADCFAGGEYRYLPDVARLEWSCQEVLAAPEHAPLDLATLRSLPPDRHASLVFQLHPATRIVASRFPVLRIWQANQPHSDASDRIELGEPQRVLVSRAASALEFRLLNAPDSEFLAGAARAETFESCAEHAQALGDFDAAATLRRFVSAGVIVGFSLAPRD
jgi:hypothetical protein